MENEICKKKQFNMSKEHYSSFELSSRYKMDECQSCSRKKRRQCKNRFIPQNEHPAIKKIKRIEITPKPIKINGKLINPSGKQQVGFKCEPKPYPKKGFNIIRMSYPRVTDGTGQKR